MSSPLLVPAMLTMAIGTYLLRWAGPALRTRVRFPRGRPGCSRSVP